MLRELLEVIGRRGLEGGPRKGCQRGIPNGGLGRGCGRGSGRESQMGVRRVVWKGGTERRVPKEGSKGVSVGSKGLLGGLD